MLRIRFDGAAEEILGSPESALGDLTGLFVAPDGFEGWDDGGGDARRESIDRPSNHGEFDLPVYHGARVFSIDGWALATTDEELAHLRSIVTGIGATGDRVKVTVEHQGQTLWAYARRALRTTFRDSGIRHGLRRARFVMQFSAADPRKYGEVRDVPAGTPAAHRGNFPAMPLLMVGAGSGGYTVTGPNGRVVVVVTAPAAAHYIDFATGGLYTAAGVRQVGAITTYQPWSIPAGLPGVTASINGSRTLTQRVTDTFI
ncbi:hypothetical protein J7E68_01660 [Microbacterium sp. ISL-103]|uniref:hypothetical protein n=1 Tax=Microbacterium sp. ISL-103 TaxID=2819156 RepID=UPI001BE7FA97|nr:hypothetical protein [Microbacterium sp. ISL-103]MBT2473314.1 hypothetical protein [Microbacterium sp. ISL-103]